MKDKQEVSRVDHVRGWKLSLHSIDEGKMTYGPDISSRGEERGKRTYKTILNIHTPLVRFWGSNDIKTPHHSRDDDSKHHLGQILTTANTSTIPEWHHMLIHAREPFLGGGVYVQPTIREEGFRGRKDGSIAMHRPGLSADDCTWGKSESHQVDVVARRNLGGVGGDDTLEEAGGGTVYPQT